MENSAALPASTPAAARNINRLKHAVYCEMYRLEVQEPGSEMGLALALLRLIVASQQVGGREETANWLKEICPIALAMIEDGLARYVGCPPSKL